MGVAKDHFDASGTSSKQIIRFELNYWFRASWGFAWERMMAKGPPFISTYLYTSILNKQKWKQVFLYRRSPEAIALLRLLLVDQAELSQEWEMGTMKWTTSMIKKLILPDPSALFVALFFNQAVSDLSLQSIFNRKFVHVNFARFTWWIRFQDQSWARH